MWRGGAETFVLSGVQTLVCQTAERQTATRPPRWSRNRTDGSLLAHLLFFHLTNGRIYKLLLFLQLKIQGHTIKPQLGVSACMPACLID